MLQFFSLKNIDVIEKEIRMNVFLVLSSTISNLLRPLAIISIAPTGLRPLAMISTPAGRKNLYIFCRAKRRFPFRFAGWKFLQSYLRDKIWTGGRNGEKNEKDEGAWLYHKTRTIIGRYQVEGVILIRGGLLIFFYFFSRFLFLFFFRVLSSFIQFFSLRSSLCWW